MKEIGQLLEDFQHQLLKSGCPIAAYLQPGIPKDRIDEIISAYDVLLPDEVYALYAWKDGLNLEDLNDLTFPSKELFNGAIFPALELIVREYKEFAIDSPFYPPHYFPLFNNGGGDFFLINTARNLPTYGRICWFSFSNHGCEGNMAPYYDSLLALLKSLIACYDQGAYVWNGGELMVDFKLEQEICRELNPLSAHWSRYLI